MLFPKWLGLQVSCAGPPRLLTPPHEISWETRVVDATEAQRFCEWVQASQVELGFTISSPCVWCGLATGDYCEWCPPECGPESRLCSACGWWLGQCRICRIMHLANGLRTVVPPSGSATFGTHRCGQCGRQGAHLRHCEACLCLRYCNRDCQKKHWKQHKSVCPLLAGMVMPSTSSLHFVYSWHISRLPSYMHVPNGICTAHLDRCRLRALGGLLRDAGPQLRTEKERRRAARRIMREAHVHTIDDSFHMGIALTDGMGLIDPALVTG